MILAHACEFVEPPGHERERILPFPMLRIGLSQLEVQHAAVLDQTERALPLRLLDTRLQAQRLDEAIPKADVAQPWFVQIHAQYEVSELGARLPVIAWIWTNHGCATSALGIA